MHHLRTLGLCLVLAFSPSAPADDGKGEPPAPAGGKEGPDRPPDAAPVPAPPGDGTPAPTAPPATIEEAFGRLETLRKAPLLGVGAYVRRLERIKSLAAEALAIHGKSPAAGEDLHRLAEICADAEKFDEAAAFAAKYVEPGAGPSPAGAGHAHSIRVRSLARAGKIPEAEAAFKSYRTAFPKAEGLPPSLKSVGDAFVAAGRVEEGAARYREALELHPRPLRAGAAATVQAFCEALHALGRSAEARRVAEKAVVETQEREAQARIRAVLRRVEMSGEALPPGAPDLWLGGPGPTAESLRGKVVVWHFFAWWMQKGTEELDDWTRRAADLAAKGVVFLPLTRTAGYDPATEKVDPEAVKPEAEAASLEKVMKERGWKGPLGLSVGGKLFAAFRIRGVPTEIVVGRDGRVRFVRGGSEGGQALTRFAMERAALEAAPPAPVPSGEAPKEPPPAAPPEKEK